LRYKYVPHGFTTTYLDVQGRQAVTHGCAQQDSTEASEGPLTISVPEAGWRYFGLSRNGSYLAAARGDIPTIRIGRLLRVPVRAMERVLDAAGRWDVA
jgi:hypothetical protein